VYKLIYYSKTNTSSEAKFYTEHDIENTKFTNMNTTTKESITSSAIRRRNHDYEDELEKKQNQIYNLQEKIYSLETYKMQTETLKNQISFLEDKIDKTGNDNSEKAIYLSEQLKLVNYLYLINNSYRSQNQITD